MIYANAGWCEKELNTAALRKDYQIWMARYNTYTYKESKDKGQRYGGQIDFWQCSDNAKINGINTAVDFDYWYQLHPAASFTTRVCRDGCMLLTV